jgi:cell division protein FtsQ
MTVKNKWALFSGLGVIAGVTALGLSGAFGNWMSDDDSFRMTQIEIRGNALLSTRQVEKQSGLKTGVSIWDVDLKQVTRDIERHPLVEKAVVSRRFPGTIRVEIEEKKPVALVSSKGKVFCLDEHGTVMPTVPGRAYDFPMISGLPPMDIKPGKRLEGPLVEKGMLFLSTVRKERPELLSRISELTFKGPDGMTLYLAPKAVPVWIGKGDPAWKIRCLDALVGRLGREKRWPDVRYINLRFESQIIVGMEKPVHVAS